MNILVLNAGSSTIKSSVFRSSAEDILFPDPIWSGVIDWGKGFDKVEIHSENSLGRIENQTYSFTPDNDLFGILLHKILETEPLLSKSNPFHAVGHRVVHGGKYTNPVRITKEVKKTIEDLTPLAPLHNPSNLKGINAIETLLPVIPQYAVFDTAYHTSMQDLAATYPIPLAWRERGIKKYGFHGINHQYCVERIGELLGKEYAAQKIITCHLGNGSSLTASYEMRCVDTTMGFTPLDGLMMGSRSGAIDPGILFYLFRNQNLSPEEIEYALYHASGFIGMCNISDMRVIQDKVKNGDRKAILAFEMYLHRLCMHMGAMAAAMNGVDTVVFSGGIGENSSLVRQKTCEKLSFLGIYLDDARNAICLPDQEITKKGSKVRVFVIRAREDFSIAKTVHCLSKTV